MKDLSPIVKQRMARQSAAGDHPDANLLSAFVEQSLTERERGGVLNHLASCARCREQIALAMPEVEAEVEATREVAANHRRPGWLRWRVLRWGVLAASLAIMSTLAWMRRTRPTIYDLASRAPVQTAQVRNPVAAPQPPQPSNATIGSPVSKASEAAKDKDRRERALVRQTPSGTAPELETAMTSGRAGAVPESLLGLQAKKEKQGPTELALRSEPRSAPVAAGMERNAAVNAPPPPPSANLAVPAEEPRTIIADSGTNKGAKGPPPTAPGHSVGGPVGGVVGGAVVAKPTTPPSPIPATRANSNASPSFARSLAPGAAPASGVRHANTLLVEWSISETGKVQRSRDRGKTWEEVPLDKDVVFRAVFASGTEVWLGGSKGTLYHSTDGGVHWQQMTLAAGSTAIIDDVVRIDFSDPRNGTVTTGSSGAFVTTDGGQSWRPK